MPVHTPSLSAAGPALPASHLRRLRTLWRSAGWPCHDPVEAELVTAGWLLRRFDTAGRESLQLTDAAVAALAAATQARRAALSAHDALVARVVRALQREGRIVWRELSLRAPLALDVAAGAATPADPWPGTGAGAAPPSEPPSGPRAAPSPAPGLFPLPASAPTPGVRWVQARPDVFSVRHATREDALAPVAHEVKVRRADLLADLRHPDKARAYAALTGECWYVLAAGIAHADEIPRDYGVLIEDGAGLAVARPAPRRALRLAFPTWMALARAAPVAPDDEPAQPELAPAAVPGADGIMDGIAAGITTRDAADDATGSGPGSSA